MTTHVFSSPIAASTDAAWQAACNEIYGTLETYLTQVPQTGELTYPVAVARPAAPNYAGWRVYRFDDPLQATCPIFLKLFVGLGYNSNIILKCEIGFEVDGSGNFVGGSSGEVSLTAQTNSGSNVHVSGSHPSFVSKQNGFFAFAYKCGGVFRGSVMCLVIGRTTDNNGQPTDEGFFVCYGMTTGSVSGVGSRGELTCAQQCFRFSPRTIYTNGRNSCFIPGYGTNSGGFGGEIEAYLNYTVTPMVKPNVWMAGIYANEFPLGTQFQATMVGASPRRYLSLGEYIGQAANESTTRNTGFAIIWEA